MWLYLKPVCAACGGHSGVDPAFGIYVSPRGEKFPHLICAKCSEHYDGQTLAEIVELRLTPAEGAA
jgi:hypothetical protein